MCNFLLSTDTTAVTESINELLIDTAIASSISNFAGNSIVITIITTIISIFVGVAFSFKNRFWRNFTIIVCAIIFNLYMILRWIFISEPIHCFIFSIVSWLILCIISFTCIKEKNIVSRKKIGKLIEKFTSIANPSKDVCIFAGDIDFFGDVIEKSDCEKINQVNRQRIISKLNDSSVSKNKKNKLITMYLHTTNIKYNSQFNQLNNNKFKKICILCAKPSSCKSNKNEDYYDDHKDRIRIGYIRNSLGDRVQFRFFDDEYINCPKYWQNIYTTNKCIDSDNVECERHKKYHSLPDTTLRGRIVTNMETGAKCVAITTKRSSRKDYILRQYGSGEKESSLYDVIWNVWWNMCNEDNDFIQDCTHEYSDAKENIIDY